jgi:serine/threonine protein kinase
MFEYLAPELLSETGFANFSSDLWDLACLMYRMASGTTPFAYKDNDEMVERI